MFIMEDEDKISSIPEDVDNVAKRKVADMLVARWQARAASHLDKVLVFRGTTEGDPKIWHTEKNTGT